MVTDDWSNLHASLQELEASINQDLKALDISTLNQVSTTVSELHETMNASFALLKDTSSSVKASRNLSVLLIA